MNHVAEPLAFAEVADEFWIIECWEDFRVYIRRLSKLICNPVVLSALRLLVLAFAIKQILLGRIYFHDCPIDPHIPIYLIVAGGTKFVSISIGLISTVVHACINQVLRRCRSNHDHVVKRYYDEPSPRRRFLHRLRRIITIFHFLMSLVGTVWLFPGAYWVLNSYKPDFVDETSQRYCSPLLYTFSFIVVSAHFTLILLVLFTFALVGFVGVVFGCNVRHLRRPRGDVIIMF